MKNQLFFAAVLLMFAACNDPIFYTISQEVEPKDPRINGGPTNFTSFNNAMYVASGNTLHRYTKDGWDKKEKVPQPDGRIIRLAATGNYLYALCRKDESTVIKRYPNKSNKWEEIGGETGSYKDLQSIYEAGDKVFIGAENNDFFTFFRIDDSASANAAIKKITGVPIPKGENKEHAGELCGAAFNGSYYYLCTKDTYVMEKDKDDKDIGIAGIFQLDISANTASRIDSSKDKGFTGIINLDDINIAAITREGILYNVKAGSVTKTNISMDSMSNGALAIWTHKDKPSQRLLLAARQDSLEYSVYTGYTYGYLELELDSTKPNGIKDGAVFTEPGKKAISSIEDSNNDLYKSTIGKHPVTHLFQTPDDVDSKRILFASTQKSGVWSYREREWNAEE
ncbi:MAG: hypothetical protein LBH44_11875 [Treponema sp.]|jgi:hypothetical protein|nr:hypothetical protein [Treponema sp.]